jgi:hypothetical protein
MPEDEISIFVDTREVEAALEALPSRLEQVNALRPAFEAAGLVMLAPMKALCPERTTEIEGADNNSLQPGVLRESLTMEVQIKENKPPRVKVGAPIETNQVANLIEQGFDNVKSKTHISGKHFMSAAFDESAEAAIGVFIETLGENLKLGPETAEGE